MDEFTKAYIKAALFSTDDENNAPLDENYDASSFHQDTIRQIVEDCRKFQFKAKDVIKDYNLLDKTNGLMEQAGHDFWLTRNHHGAGFWDGDWEAYAGDELTKICDEFGEFNLYIGENNKIYSDKVTVNKDMF